MKKLFIIATAFIAFSFQTIANAKTVSNDAKDDSVSAYVSNNASKIVWTVVNNFNVAKFQKDGYQMKAFFDEQGNLVSTTRLLKNRNELPKAAIEKLDTDYAGWGMTDLCEEKGMDTDVVYYARISDGDRSMILKINAKGKISRF